MRISALFDNVDAADRAAEMASAQARILRRNTVYPHGTPAWSMTTEPMNLLSPYAGEYLSTFNGGGIQTIPHQQPYPGTVFPNTLSGGVREEVRLELEVADAEAELVKQALINAHARELR